MVVWAIRTSPPRVRFWDTVPGRDVGVAVGVLVLGGTTNCVLVAVAVGVSVLVRVGTFVEVEVLVGMFGSGVRVLVGVAKVRVLVGVRDGV